MVHGWCVTVFTNEKKTPVLSPTCSASVAIFFVLFIIYYKSYTKCMTDRHTVSPIKTVRREH